MNVWTIEIYLSYADLVAGNQSNIPHSETNARSLVEHLDLPHINLKMDVWWLFAKTVNANQRWPEEPDQMLFIAQDVFAIS